MSVIKSILSAPAIMQHAGIAGIAAFFFGVILFAIGVSIFLAAIKRDRYQDKQSRKGVWK